MEGSLLPRCSTWERRGVLIQQGPGKGKETLQVQASDLRLRVWHFVQHLALLNLLLTEVG